MEAIIINTLQFRESILLISLIWEGDISLAQTCPPAQPHRPRMVVRMHVGASGGLRGAWCLHRAAGPTRAGLTSPAPPDVPEKMTDKMGAVGIFLGTQDTLSGDRHICGPVPRAGRASPDLPGAWPGAHTPALRVIECFSLPQLPSFA